MDCKSAGLDHAWFDPRILHQNPGVPSRYSQGVYRLYEIVEGAYDLPQSPDGGSLEKSQGVADTSREIIRRTG